VVTASAAGWQEDASVLAVDIGTGGPKVGLVSLAGTIAGHKHTAVPTDLPPDGGATQDAGQWRDLIRDSARRALASGVADPASVAAVWCTGQRASTVPVDAEGIPVGPCQLWSDTRGGIHSRAVIAGPVAGYDPVALVRWIR
jgi:xylulokinase